MSFSKSCQGKGQNIHENLIWHKPKQIGHHLLNCSGQESGLYPKLLPPTQWEYPNSYSRLENGQREH